MKKPKIQSITEAYSIYPETFRVYDKERHGNLTDNSIKKITFETKIMGDNKHLNYYVGYNFEGKKIFEYLLDSVNVHFKK